MTDGENVPPNDALRDLMAEVPKAYATRFTDLVGLTDAFCDAHLNAEYKGLCREMAVAVCQKGSPVLKGKAEGWAAGIVYALGRVNFLDDPSQTPHMKSTEIAEGFGVSVATMQAKTHCSPQAGRPQPRRCRELQQVPPQPDLTAAKPHEPSRRCLP